MNLANLSNSRLLLLLLGPTFAVQNYQFQSLINLECYLHENDYSIPTVGGRARGEGEN
jgi:hypothetical protein